MTPCLHMNPEFVTNLPKEDIPMYYCRSCGMFGVVEEKLKKNKETGEDELAMWTRIWGHLP